MADNDTTTFMRINSEMDGLVIVSILEEHGIPARIISQQVSMYDNVFKTAQGFWGEVLVPPELHEKAREVLDEFYDEEYPKEGTFQIDPDFMPGYPSPEED